MNTREWFRSAKFGMMIHWGLYALPSGEWKGSRIPGLGEWIQYSARIPNAEYEPLAKAFNPILFDPDEWVNTACRAGMKYMVVTSKHHDGFAMYRSKVSKYNVYDATPFHRDVIGELAVACRRRGLRLGLYYSQDLDWNHPHGGGYVRPGTEGKDRSNNWDFTDAFAKDYAICFEEKIKPQVKEILSNYGDICLIWFDVPATITDDQSVELYELVKSLQPDCLVNSRIGNNRGDYISTGDNQIGYETKGQTDKLFECPATLNDTWGWKSFDNNWKPSSKVIELKNRLNAEGINYLLNVGPDHLGRFPVPATDILREVGMTLGV